MLEMLSPALMSTFTPLILIYPADGAFAGKSRSTDGLVASFVTSIEYSPADTVSDMVALTLSLSA